MPDLIPHSALTTATTQRSGSEGCSRGPIRTIHALHSNFGSRTLLTYYYSIIDSVHTYIEDNVLNPVVTYDLKCAREIRQQFGENPVSPASTRLAASISPPKIHPPYKRSAIESTLLPSQSSTPASTSRSTLADRNYHKSLIPNRANLHHSKNRTLSRQPRQILPVSGVISSL